MGTVRIERNKEAIPKSTHNMHFMDYEENLLDHICLLDSQRNMQLES